MAALSVRTAPVGSSRVGTWASGLSAVRRFDSDVGLLPSISSISYGSPDNSRSASAIAEPQPGTEMSVYLAVAIGVSSTLADAFLPRRGLDPKSSGACGRVIAFPVSHRLPYTRNSDTGPLQPPATSLVEAA